MHVQWKHDHTQVAGAWTVEARPHSGSWCMCSGSTNHTQVAGACAVEAQPHSGSWCMCSGSTNHTRVAGACAVTKDKKGRGEVLVTLESPPSLTTHRASCMRSRCCFSQPVECFPPIPCCHALLFSILYGTFGRVSSTCRTDTVGPVLIMRI